MGPWAHCKDRTAVPAPDGRWRSTGWGVAGSFGALLLLRSVQNVCTRTRPCAYARGAPSPPHTPAASFLAPRSGRRQSGVSRRVPDLAAQGRGWAPAPTESRRAAVNLAAGRLRPAWRRQFESEARRQWRRVESAGCAGGSDFRVRVLAGLAGALGRSGRGAPKSGAPGWGAGRCKISGALTFKTGKAIVGIEPSFSRDLG